MVTRDVSLGLLGGSEKAGRLAHVVRALAGPWDLRGIRRGEDGDRSAVHHEASVLDLPCTEKCNTSGVDGTDFSRDGSTGRYSSQSLLHRLATIAKCSDNQMSVVSITFIDIMVSYVS